MARTDYLTATEFRAFVEHIDSQFLSFLEFFESMKDVPADVAQLRDDIVEAKAELREHSMILKDHTKRLDRLEKQRA
jgi:hypothetical protein